MLSHGLNSKLSLSRNLFGAPKRSLSLSLQALWPRLYLSLSSSNLDLSPHLKQALWDALRSVPTLKFHAKNAPYGPVDPSILSFEDAEKLNLNLLADEGLRDNFMGLNNVRSANASLSKIQRTALERHVMARTNGITQSSLLRNLALKGGTFIMQ